MPRRPISPISWKMSSGKRCSRSRSATPGWMRSTAKRRTSSRRSCWSSVSEKSTPVAAVASATGSASTAIRVSSGLGEHPVGDHHLLDLAGALVDLGDAGVAEVALDVVLLGVAVAAVDLQRLVGDPLGHLGGEQLGLGGFEGVALLVLLGPRRLPGEQAGGVELGRHVREVELDRLEVGEMGAELLALLRVGQRLLEGPLGDADRLGGDADAAAVEGGHGDLEAVSLLAETVAGRDAQVLEGQLGGARGVDAQLE